jgi:hypothetical protein
VRRSRRGGRGGEELISANRGGGGWADFSLGEE